MWSDSSQRRPPESSTFPFPPAEDLQGAEAVGSPVLDADAVPFTAVSVCDDLGCYDAQWTETLLVGPWRGAWVTAFYASFSDAPRCALPLDLPAMVLHMLNRRVVTEAAKWATMSATTDAFHRPNWWRAVRLNTAELEAGQLHDVLAAIPHLRRLDCCGGDLPDVAAAALSSFRHLDDIHFEGATAVDLDKLKDIAPRLTSLHFDRVRSLKDMTAVLPLFSRLRCLSLTRTGVTRRGAPSIKLHGIHQLHCLETLVLAECAEVTSLDVLAECLSLQHIDVSGTSVSTIAPLRKVTTLRTVTANRCLLLGGRHELDELSSLTSLSVTDCPDLIAVESRSATLEVLWLSGCTSLNSLVIRSNALKSLRARGVPCVVDATMAQLAELPRLAFLDVRDCRGVTTLKHPFGALTTLFTSLREITPADAVETIPTLRQYNGEPTSTRRPQAVLLPPPTQGCCRFQVLAIIGGVFGGASAFGVCCFVTMFFVIPAIFRFDDK